MRKLLLEINILLDLYLQRQPWEAEAAILVSAVENGRASRFPTCYRSCRSCLWIGRTSTRRSCSDQVTSRMPFR